LVKIATSAAKALSGRKRLSKLNRSDLAEAIQLICGIATVFPNNKYQILILYITHGYQVSLMRLGAIPIFTMKVKQGR
jgi:hypothetical protein